MNGYYGRDKIRITPVTKNATTGEVTPGTPFVVNAMVEDLDSIRKVESKRDPDSDLFIIVWDTVDSNGNIVDIQVGYYLELIEQFCVPLSSPYKQRIVQQASRMGGMTQNSLEVFA